MIAFCKIFWEKLLPVMRLNRMISIFFISDIHISISKTKADIIGQRCATSLVVAVGKSPFKRDKVNVAK
jgi:hypothetical protein